MIQHVVDLYIFNATFVDVVISAIFTVEDDDCQYDKQHITIHINTVSHTGNLVDYAFPELHHNKVKL